MPMQPNPNAEPFNPFFPNSRVCKAALLSLLPRSPNHGWLWREAHISPHFSPTLPYPQRPGALSRKSRSLFGGHELEVSVEPVRHIHEQPDRSALAAFRQPVDGQGRLFRLLHKDPDLLLPDLDPGTEPPVRVGHRVDWCLEDPRPSLAQLLPGVLRPCDVLDGPPLEDTLGFEVERAKVHGLKCLFVDHVERDTQEAFLPDILPLQFDLDRSRGELGAVDEGEADDSIGRISLGFEPDGVPALELHGLGRGVGDLPTRAVEDLAKLGRDDLFLAVADGTQHGEEEDPDTPRYVLHCCLRLCRRTPWRFAARTAKPAVRCKLGT